MDMFYQVEDIAARYGVTLGTVYDWIRRGRLTALKLGKRYYIRDSDIERMEQLGATESAKAQSAPLKL